MNESKKCQGCGNTIFRNNEWKSKWLKRKYCSLQCAGLGKKGIERSEETKEKIRKKRALQIIPKESYEKRSLKYRGVNHQNWKGGFPKCLDCGIQLNRYLSKRCKKCDGKRKQGENSPHWKGGFFYKDGYKFVKAENHPRKTQHGYIREQWLIVEKQLGRYLTSKEIVHHINEIKNDNRIENLYLFESLGKHNGYHHKLRFGKIDKIIMSNLI